MCLEHRQCRAAKHPQMSGPTRLNLLFHPMRCHIRPRIRILANRMQNWGKFCGSLDLRHVGLRQPRRTQTLIRSPCIWLHPHSFHTKAHASPPSPANCRSPPPRSHPFHCPPPHGPVRSVAKAGGGGSKGGGRPHNQLGDPQRVPLRPKEQGENNFCGRPPTIS